MENRLKLFLLIITVLMMMLGVGVVNPVLAFWASAYGAGGRTFGALLTTFAVTLFLFAPIWGVLSDRYGRKPVLVVGVIGNIAAHLAMAGAGQLWALFASRALAGIFAACTLPVVLAYVGDILPKRERGGGFGLLIAMQGLGMGLGPLIGGSLAGSSITLPFLVAAGFYLLALPLVIIVLPESVTVGQNQSGLFDRSRLHALQQELQGPIVIILVLGFLFGLGQSHYAGIFDLYTIRRFGYDSQQVSIMVMLLGLFTAVVQGACTGPVTRRWGDVRVLRVTLLLSGFGFLLLTVVTTFPMVLLAVSFFGISSALLRPVLIALGSQRTTGGQGLGMGLLSAAISLGGILGPISAGFLFDLGLAYPFYAGGITRLAGFLISIIWIADPMRILTAAVPSLPRPTSPPESHK